MQQREIDALTTGRGSPVGAKEGPPRTRRRRSDRSGGLAAAWFAGLTGLAGVASAAEAPTRYTLDPPTVEPGSAPLRVVAESSRRQWTGVAVTDGGGRLFVNYPSWGGPYLNAVEEVHPDGLRSAYPNTRWNTWVPGDETDPGSRFVCVQSVHVDREGTLWVLDPASPLMAGVVPGGAKLVRIDLDTDAVERVYRFGEGEVFGDSYLNDVRVDPQHGFAFITDSGRGGMLVVDLEGGATRRVLDGHPSTLADPAVEPTIGGRPWRTREGGVPQIHADGIALSPDGEFVYYQALTARRLYRIPTAALRDFELPADAVAAEVEDLGETVVTDGMAMDPAGNLYFSALELDAVVVRTPEGELLELARDPSIAWPDSFAVDASGGRLFVTTAQIHRGAQFEGGVSPGMPPPEPYRVFELSLAGTVVLPGADPQPALIPRPTARAAAIAGAPAEATVRRTVPTPPSPPLAPRPSPPPPPSPGPSPTPAPAAATASGPEAPTFAPPVPGALVTTPPPPPRVAAPARTEPEPRADIPPAPRAASAAVADAPEPPRVPR